MAITFDFDGSLQLAAKLVALADMVEADATSRQGPRDAALAWRSFRGPYGTAHRAFADDEDEQIELAERCRIAATGWARAWTRAVDDHNDEVCEEARRLMVRLNEGRVGRWRLIQINDPDAFNPFPELGTVPAPKPAEEPAGDTYAATNSIVSYIEDGPDLVPEYRSSL